MDVYTRGGWQTFVKKTKTKLAQIFSVSVSQGIKKYKIRVGEEGGEIALITDPGAIWAFWNLRESFRNVELFNDGSIYINCYVDSFEEF